MEETFDVRIERGLLVEKVQQFHHMGLPRLNEVSFLLTDQQS